MLDGRDDLRPNSHPVRLKARRIPPGFSFAGFRFTLATLLFYVGSTEWGDSHASV